MADATLVTAGKPKTTGSVFRAPIGTTPPTNATAALTGFTDLGYCSEDGLKNNNSPSSEKVKAWGGDVVLNLQTEKPDEWSFTLISAKDVNVLKTVYGADNVSGTLATGITVEANSDELPDSVWVFDMVLKGGTLKRVVLPVASIAEISEITYADKSAVGYGIKLNAMPDSSGNTHYEYMINNSGSSSSS